MAREEAIKNCEKIKNYLSAGNPIWDTSVIIDTLDTAIKALEQPERSDEVNFWKERARKYEDISIGLIAELANGVKIDSIEITGEGIRFKKSQPEPGWIPVAERLPGEEDYHDFWEFPDGAVLWCKDTGEIGIGWYYKLTKNWGDLWDNAVRNIVAWMPLPEPYERSEDERIHQD